ncbi:MAG: TIGR02677 family protein [Selenomonadaceae bacterium]|nr:TIGR02677 family protein [Selenomonadaceae bacterium]
MDEQDLRRITEVSYLNTDNTWRYRAILHFCFKRHEHMQTYVYPEDIFHELTKDPSFQEYTFEQLEQDLSMLVSWKNLIPHQETGRAKTIADFKKRRYRYQCTPYTVEIERMVERLKTLGEEFSGSLETTQFDRILRAMRDFLLPTKPLSDEELNQTWQDLEHYFHTLVQNASDYLAHIKSAKVEERMQTVAFIVYKDRFTQYLQTFVVGLQRSAKRLENLFEQSTPEAEDALFQRLTDYQLSIPRLGEEKSRDAYLEDFRESFLVMREWFIGTGYRDSELATLSRETVDTIRRITKFAQRLAEQHQVFRSRKAEYLHLARWFSRLPTKEEADRLSAIVFGVAGGRHFYGEPREAEDMNRRLEEEPATKLTLKPRVNTYRERTRQVPVQSRRNEKAAARQAHLLRQQKLAGFMQSLSADGIIDFAGLPVLSREARQMLLGWVAKALQRNPIHTELGTVMELMWNRQDRSSIVMHCEDGDFSLPHLKFRICS